MANKFHLVLASTSPRRREFMITLGIPFTTVSPNTITEVDETPFPQEPPSQLVQRLSQSKATAIADNLDHFPALVKLAQTHHLVVIGADTVVVLDNIILGKPQTPAEATQMLKALRLQAHDVYSGLTLIHFSPLTTPTSQQQIITHQHRSRVWMRPYTDAEIAAYVATGSPLDKAGAYGIQDQPFAPVEQLDGCFASVMGLPLAELTNELRQIGISLPPTSTICHQHTNIPCCQN